MAEKSKIEYMFMPLDLSLRATRWLGGGALKAAKLGVETTTRRIASDGQRLSDHVQFLHSVGKREHDIVQELKRRRGILEPDSALGLARELVDVFIEKDPDSPVEQHVIGAGNLLLTHGAVDVSTTLDITRTLGVETGADLPHLIEDADHLTKNLKDPI